MASFFKIFVIFSVFCLFIGCAAHFKWYYKNKTRNIGVIKLGANIPENSWGGEFKTAIREKAVEKTRQLPIIGDSANGYEGVVHNSYFSGFSQALFKIKSVDGIDGTSLHLDRGQLAKIRLLPGLYHYKIYNNRNILIGWGKFHVGAELKQYGHNNKVESCHFFVFL